jgi:dynamin 1-like protein
MKAPLRHGFFGVANRSQEQVDNDVPVKVVAQMFEDCIEGFPEYKNLRDRFGIEKLISYLGESLSGLICEGWPRIKTRHFEIDNELKMLNGEAFSKNTRSQKMKNILQQLEKEIRISIEGSSTSVNLKSIDIGARLNIMVKEGSVQVSKNVRRYFAEQEFCKMQI